MPATTIFRAGDRVRIIANHNSHWFRIGEIVTLVGSDGGGTGFCGNRVGPPNYIYPGEYEHYIPTPIAPRTPPNPHECSHCNHTFTPDELHEHSGDLYCDNCEGERFIMCEHCNESHAIADALEVDNEWYCGESCANEAGYYQCHDCDVWHNSDDSFSDRGNRICSSCYEDNYCSCDECGETCHIDDINRDGLCGDCRGGNGVIKDYSYKPREYLYAKMPWENTLYLGIELEVECGDYDNEEQAIKVMGWLTKHKLNDRVYIKDDGSLDNGFEIVFMPFTLQAIHKKFPMREFLAYLRKIGLTSHELGSCGLHVHISKTKMKDAHLLAGKIFFFKCREQIQAFSKRESFRFCQFDVSMPTNHADQYHGRYSAFNTAGSAATAEIRVFRGTLEYKRFQASLQFSDLFGEYIQNASLALLRARAAGVVWGDFIAYAKNKAKYAQLLQYIKANRIQ